MLLNLHIVHAETSLVRLSLIFLDRNLSFAQIKRSIHFFSCTCPSRFIYEMSYSLECIFSQCLVSVLQFDRHKQLQKKLNKLSFSGPLGEELRTFFCPKASLFLKRIGFRPRENTLAPGRFVFYIQHIFRLVDFLFPFFPRLEDNQTHKHLSQLPTCF